MSAKKLQWALENVQDVIDARPADHEATTQAESDAMEAVYEARAAVEKALALRRACDNATEEETLAKFHEREHGEPHPLIRKYLLRTPR